MLRERLSAQLLAGPPARDPVAVAERLLAVQAQDPRGRAARRQGAHEGLTAADVDRALTRGAVARRHVAQPRNAAPRPREDYPWLQALTTPPLFTGNARRLAQEGVSPDDAERGVEAIVRALADEGPLTREQLRQRVDAVGVRTEGQALVHLLMLASLRGLTVRGPWWASSTPTSSCATGSASNRRSTASARWPSSRAATSRGTGRRTIAISPDGRACRCATRARASPRSATSWSSAPTGSSTSGAGARAHELPPPRLLGQFEPVLLGWRSREPLVGPHESLLVSGGLFRPFALVRGRAVAAWKLAAGRVELEPFAKLGRADAAALDADADQLLRFPTVTVRCAEAIKVSGGTLILVPASRARSRSSTRLRRTSETNSIPGTRWIAAWTS